MKRLLLSRSITLVVLLCTLSAPLLADELNSDDIIKYRQATMKALGGHMGAMSRTVQGKVGFKELMPAHAAAISSLSSAVSGMFPEGSDFGDTDAKEEIWSKPAEFQSAADTAAEKAQALEAAVQGGDMATIGAAFKEVGKSCKGCHDQFREE